MDSEVNLTLALRGVTPTSPDLVTQCAGSLGYENMSYGNASTASIATCISSEGDSTSPSAHYSFLFGAVAVALSAVIFIFGTVGNTLVVLVITRTRSMHTPTNCYLLSLAVADSLVLFSAVLPAIPEPFFRIEEWPYGRALCSVLIFLQYLGIDCSALSIAAFTVERYIAICHPMRAQTMCTVSRAKHIIAGLWVFTILYCAPWLGLTEIVEHQMQGGAPLKRCQYRFARSSYMVLYMVDLILFYVMPLVVATVLYLLIGRILYMSRNIRRNDAQLVVRSSLQEAPRRRGDSRVQVIRMLVVVVLAFATLWMPYRVMVVYNSFAKHKYVDLWFLLFARTMVYINCAINSFLYNIMSLKFKRAFRNYLSCCPLYRKKSGQSTHYSEIPTDLLATRRINSSHHQHQQQHIQQHHPNNQCHQFRTSRLGSNSSVKQFKQQYHQQQKCQQNQFYARTNRTGSNSSLKNARREMKQQPQQQQQHHHQQQQQHEHEQNPHQRNHQRQHRRLFQDRLVEKPHANGNIIGNNIEKNGLVKLHLSEKLQPGSERPSKGFHSVENPISAFENYRSPLHNQLNSNLPCSDNDLASTITMNGTVVGIDMAENAV
ncbi:hypothetical protein EGW08_019499 [Elysia chlorotica]|uniref:Thyrotropin-releasing hormone receptor n=1 Tax=Elysia chlorotica TaxID=188477 RepID=A0A433SU23_ELYCH|nr:hypothetical protein EGW08_019499 [Elysia chlorotica]